MNRKSSRPNIFTWVIMGIITNNCIYVLFMWLENVLENLSWIYIRWNLQYLFLPSFNVDEHVDYYSKWGKYIMHIVISNVVRFTNKWLGASFAKQGKLARERNSKTAPMGGEISVCDLLTMCKLKNTDTTSHLHIDQRNTPSAAQIGVVANKE